MKYPNGEKRRERGKITPSQVTEGHCQITHNRPGPGNTHTHTLFIGLPSSSPSNRETSILLCLCFHFCPEVRTPQLNAFCPVSRSRPFPNHRALFTTAKTVQDSFFSLQPFGSVRIHVFYFSFNLVMTIQQASFGRDLRGRFVAQIEETTTSKLLKRLKTSFKHLTQFFLRRRQRVMGGWGRGCKGRGAVKRCTFPSHPSNNSIPPPSFLFRLLLSSVLQEEE